MLAKKDRGLAWCRLPAKGFDEFFDVHETLPGVLTGGVTRAPGLDVC
ncbi:MAG: hypothetical protein JNL50_13540 [Phycisphaerae bacterium]|nr:hypothetical protein [Phycisphaerae bacterium]